MNVQRISPEVRDITIPAPLRDLPIFLCWRLEPRYEGDPKPLKVPYYPLGNKRVGRQGSPDDRGQLTTFAVAREQAARRGMTGIGLALLEGYDLTAIDVDNCVTDGKLPDDIMAAVRSTYSEYSPSGRGIRAIMRGNLGNHKAPTTPTDYGFETFSTSGFCTLTGNALDHVDLLGLEDTIGRVTPEIEAICQKRFGASKAPIDADDFMLGREPRLGLSVGEIEEMLSYISPDCSREEWIRVGMALHHETQGDDTGLTLWDEWSADGGTYPGTEGVEYQWQSFPGPTPGRPSVTMASVIKMAKAGGYGRDTVTADDLRKVVEETAVAEASGPHTPDSYDGKFPITSAISVARRPPSKWWIKGIIPQAQIGAIYGASGSGKSFLALDFMAHLSLGIAWREHRTRKARGLYVAAEGGAGVGKRMKAWAQHNSIDLADLDIGVLTVAPNIMLKEDISELVRAITLAGGFDYIVLDTYAQVTPGANENAAEDMGLALAHCRALNEATGALVILIHHSGKDASRGVRGWSGINAALDFAIETSRDEASGYREARVTKMKDGEDGITYGFKLDIVTVGMDEDGDEVTSCVVSFANAPQREVPSGAGAKRRGRVENHVLETMVLFGTADTVRLQDLVDRATDTLPLPENGRDTRRQKVVRAIQSLSKEKDGPLKLEGGVVIFYE